MVPVWGADSSHSWSWPAHLSCSLLWLYQIPVQSVPFTWQLCHSGPCCCFHESSIKKLSCLTFVLTSALIWILQLDQLFFISIFPSHLAQGGFIHSGAGPRAPSHLLWHPRAPLLTLPACWELGSISVTFQLDSVPSETKRHLREAKHEAGGISYALKNTHGTETSITTLS